MRIVVKIGSSSLVDAEGSRNVALFGAVVDDVATALRSDHQVVLVSSGAIATGLGLLGRSTRPRELPALQAASAVGQGALFGTWSMLLELRGVRAAQVLLTMHDAAHRTSWSNARGTLEQLLDWGVVPIINENDTTATDEITFGDNDALAAQVAVALAADHLLLLTDTDGLYTHHPASPDARRIDEVDDMSLLRSIDTSSAGSHWGSGGMRSKVIAAAMARAGGVTTWITRAAEPGVVCRIVGGEHVGTRILPQPRRSGYAFRLWLEHAKPSVGVVRVDRGAFMAVMERGASLLAVGVIGLEGVFHPGDAVEIAEPDGPPFAKGLIEYGSAELATLISSPGHARGARAVVHRDQLVLLAGSTSVGSSDSESS